MASVQQWAEGAAKRELAQAKNVGAVPERQFHYGRAVVLLMDAELYNEAAELLAKGLRRTGGYGTQFVAGMRSGVVLVEGAHSLRALDEAENVEAWVESGTAALPPGDRQEAREAAESVSS